MSVVRLLPAWLHAIADYAVGAGLIVIALAVGGSTKAVAAGVVVGATVLAVSMLTRYPLGVFKILPFKVYIVAGLAVLAVSLLTNYQYGDKREWNAKMPATA